MAVVYLSSLSWQRVHYTPISMKSRLIMINYIVRRQLLSLDSSSWNVTFCRVGRAPVRVAPVRFSLGEATCLAGRRTLSHRRVSPVLWRRRTPGRVGGYASGRLGRVWPVSPSDPNSCYYSFLRSFFLVRMIVVNLTLTFLLVNSAWIWKTLVSL